MSIFCLLSDDVLLEITSYLCRKDLCDLVRTSKRLYTIGIGLLFRKVQFDISTKAFQCFSRSILDNHALGAKVEKARLLIRCGRTAPIGTVRAVVERLPNLRHLHIHHISMCDSYIELHVKPISTQCRYDLSLSHSVITQEDLAKIVFDQEPSSFSILSLRSITSDTNGSFGTTKYKPYTAPLRTLHVDHNAHIPEAILEDLLTWPQSLKSLHCAVPGTDYQSQFRTSVAPSMTVALSPSRVSRVLEKVSHSLEDLHLVDMDGGWPGHDRSRLNLQAFQTLRRMTVPSHCLFMEREASSRRKGVYELLPDSIESVMIYFDFGHYILFANPTIEASPKHYAWLMEIASNKSAKCPLLQSLNLSERLKGSKGCIAVSEMWNPPKDLAKELEEAGIRFWAMRRRGFQGV